MLRRQVLSPQSLEGGFILRKLYPKRHGRTWKNILTQWCLRHGVCDCPIVAVFPNPSAAKILGESASTSTAIKTKIAQQANNNIFIAATQ